MTTTEPQSSVQAIGEEIVHWFQSAQLDRDHWTPDAELDIWQPTSRLQFAGSDTVEQAYRSFYPSGQEITWSSTIATVDGAVVEFTTRSRDAERRFAKLCVIAHTDAHGRLSFVRVHCTGEWSPATERAHLAQGGTLDL